MPTTGMSATKLMSSRRLDCLAVQQETHNAEDTNNPGRGEDTLITLCIGKESAPARCVGNAISDVSSVEGIKESKEGERIRRRMRQLPATTLSCERVGEERSFAQGIAGVL